MFIKNFDQLATTPQRKIVLQLIEEAYSSIQSENVINNSIQIDRNILKIKEQTFDLSSFNRILLIGFGKGSARISKLIEEKLGDLLTDGYVIDTNPEDFKKIQFTQGTHPLPSQTNVDFVENLLKQTENMSEKDLVIVAITGGGSALFEAPNIPLSIITEINETLLKSGANITEMNTLRKHLSKVKAGNLAKHLYPATIITAICSDVPGNDLSVISSGPTVKDKTNIEDAKTILEKITRSDLADRLIETPKDDKYFEKVTNILILSNLTALTAMKKKAEELGYNAEIFSDKLQGDAKIVGKELIEKTDSGRILLAGGETTVKVTGHGAGGRNQEVVLGAVINIDEKTTISSFASDGWDNSAFAGAIGDLKTLEKAISLDLNPQTFLNNDNSLEFFEKTENGIETGRIPSNISDLFIVLKS
ncbi:MAG: DUF4147 domain-containing protein [Patescibacteria group bacterium]